jgi:periplasmic protein TonB
VTAPAPPPATLSRPPAPAPASAVQPLPPPGGRVQDPQLIERTLPAYPPLARRLKFTGLVHLEALVDEHGNVKEVKVLSGQPMLATAAKDAVLKWKYKPATLNGRAISTTVAIEIAFHDGNQ